jgi:ubiquinone/menaquinone biosynthesis C-methylase UbiE
MKKPACISESIPWQHLTAHEISNLTVYQFLEYLGKKVINPGGSLGLHQILDRMCIKPGSRVLDIGAGSGYAACLIAERYKCHVTAIDISTRAIEAAKERVAQRGLSQSVSCEIGDITNLRFSSGSFDYVICQAVVMFVDADIAFSEIARVLKYGGTYGGLEFCWKAVPPSYVEISTYAICGCNSLHFFNDLEWGAKLRSALPVVTSGREHSFALLSIRGFLRDEGIINSIRILLKLLRHPSSIQRMASIWNHFAKNQDYLSYIVLAAKKQ